jgi:hypothetical protein
MKSFVMAIALAPMLGCTATARRPEPVPLDRVECARCRMLISTDTGTGEIVSLHNETRFYDDIGCLAADWPAHAAGDIAYVRIDREWSEADAAAFAQPATMRTAMGSGWAAYEDGGEAQAVDRSGHAHTWDEVVRRAGGQQ